MKSPLKLHKLGGRYAKVLHEDVAVVLIVDTEHQAAWILFKDGGFEHVGAGLVEPNFPAHMGFKRMTPAFCL